MAALETLQDRHVGDEPSSPLAPIPALPYHTANDESWRNLVRLLLIVGIVLGAMDIMMSGLNVAYMVSVGGRTNSFVEAIGSYAAAAVQFVIGLATLVVCTRARSFERDSDRAIVWILRLNLVASCLFTAWGFVIIAMHFSDYRTIGMGYLAWIIGYNVERFLLAALPAFVGIYLFTRADTRQLFVA